MSKRHFAVAAVFLGLLLLFVLRDRNRPPAQRGPVSPHPASTTATQISSAAPPAPSIPERKDLPGQPALTAPSPAELSIDERPPLADALGSTRTTPSQEPKIVLEILYAYRRYFGEFPAGENNQQLMNALLGGNREKLPFIPHDHPRLNKNGELVDAWGSPFFFHQNSRSSIEVRSAGPDRLLYTDDDLVVGQPTRPVHPAPPAENPES